MVIFTRLDGSKHPVLSGVSRSSLLVAKASSNTAVLEFPASNTSIITSYIGFSTNPSAYLVMNTPTATLSAINPSAYMVLSTPTTTFSLTPSTNPSASLVLNTETSSVFTTGSAYLLTNSPTETTTTSSVQVSTAAPTSGSAYFVSGTPRTTLLQTTPTSGDPNSASELHMNGPFTLGDYFIGTYLATFLAVVLKQVWTLVFASFKMMEPFYKLAHPEGTSACDALLINYVSTSLSTDSILHGSYTMALASIIYLSIGIIAPLASESISIKPQAICSTNIGNSPCNALLVVHRPITYALQSLLGLVSLLILILILMSRKRRSANSFKSNVHRDNGIPASPPRSLGRIPPFRNVYYIKTSSS